MDVRDYAAGSLFPEEYPMTRSAWVPALLMLLACASGGTKQAPAATRTQAMTRYLDNSGRPDVLSGGARLLTVQTPKGPFRVWTKRVGNNPRI